MGYVSLLEGNRVGFSRSFNGWFLKVLFKGSFQIGFGNPLKPTPSWLTPEMNMAKVSPPKKRRNRRFMRNFVPFLWEIFQRFCWFCLDSAISKAEVG